MARLFFSSITYSTFRTCVLLLPTLYRTKLPSISSSGECLLSNMLSVNVWVFIQTSFFFFFSPVTQYSWGLEVNCSYLSLVTGSGPTLSVESPCFMENQALSLFIDCSEATQYHIVMLVYSTSECETKEHLICLVCTSAIQDGCNQLSGWHAAVLHLYLNFLI